MSRRSSFVAYAAMITLTTMMLISAVRDPFPPDPWINVNRAAWLIFCFGVVIAVREARKR